MTIKRKIQTAVDLCMVVLLPMLMAYNLISEVAHEYCGVAMILLFLCHHLLNRHWYKSLAKGKYSKTRILSVAVNFLLLIIMAALAASGVAALKHLFTFLPIKGGQTVTRTIHLLSSYCLKGQTLIQNKPSISEGCFSASLEKALFCGLSWISILSMFCADF